MEVRHISQYIDLDPHSVAHFTRNSANLPAWASGLARGIEHRGDDWIASSPMGEVVLRFAPPNDLGVLDHDVTTPDGTPFHNPMRVPPNGTGSEIVFTLCRAEGVGVADFDADATTIAADFAALRDILEGGTGE